jgi:hypothetical protein
MSLVLKNNRRLSRALARHLLLGKGVTERVTMSGKGQILSLEVSLIRVITVVKGVSYVSAKFNFCCTSRKI